MPQAHLQINLSSFHELFRASDAELVMRLLDAPDPQRAHAILEITGSLVNLNTMGPLELLALPLSSTEQARVALQCEIATRVMARLRLAPREAGLFEPTR